ncbi:hypothetical protein DID88_005063 [Monilinia fructigena]|uniref:Major facilitator superfamily (MFS) profile domain-containing protein n=1 Tax=Monilinia fructigena TaxID=38457 RepID=A0A395ISC7_9HELO|nr:hypothetical protein DID88_005063 [Monilinia fructigena]
MGPENVNVEERRIGIESRAEKPHVYHEENVEHLNKSAHAIAERGHEATDRRGQSLVTFDPVAERKLRLKIDLMIVPTVALLYLFCFIDRANIGKSHTITISLSRQVTLIFNVLGNAKLAGLEKDLKMVLAGSFLQLRWHLASAQLPPRFVHNVHTISVVRFLLGIFEAGMMPGIAYYLSRWYRRSELAFRLSLYIFMAPLAGAFGGLLASGILKLSNFGTLRTWRMIFAIEGIVTCCLSVISFLTLTDRPATAKWLTQEEKVLAIARVKSERVGATEVLDAFDSKKILRGIFNPVTIATSLIFLLDNITVQGLAFFAPTIVKTIYPKATVVSQQLHTVPPYIVGAFFTLLFPFLSWRFDRRNIFFIMNAPLMMCGYIMFLASTEAQTRYGATFLIASGAFSFGALCNAQVAANVVSDTARSSAIGTTVMMGNVGGLISTWSFLPNDAPNYHIGNGLNLATSTATLLLSIGLLLWMKMDNKKRDKRDVDAELDGLSQRQIQDLDWRHPGFEWKP